MKVDTFISNYFEKKYDSDARHDTLIIRFGRMQSYPIASCHSIHRGDFASGPIAIVRNQSPSPPPPVYERYYIIIIMNRDYCAEITRFRFVYIISMDPAPPLNPRPRHRIAIRVNNKNYNNTAARECGQRKRFILSYRD